MTKLLTTIALVAALAAGGATTASADAGQTRTILVTGQGEIMAAPDMAVLSIGVETEGKTAADALQKNRDQMTATLNKLKNSGVAEKDIQTQNLSVNPRYNYEESRSTPKILGYTASNTLTVKLRDLDKAGAIIDAAVTEGANSLGGLSFAFADPKPLENKAREQAVKDARDKAALYAKAADVSLGPVLQIQDGYASAPPPQPYMDMRVMAAEAKSTPISAGESTVSATVTMVYSIK